MYDYPYPYDNDNHRDISNIWIVYGLSPLRHMKTMVTYGYMPCFTMGFCHDQVLELS